MVSLAFSSGVRSGRLAASIGVGTVTMKKFAVFNVFGSVSNFKCLADFRSSVVHSRVRSCPPWSSSTRRASISKPMTGSLRLKCTASGSPT